MKNLCFCQRLRKKVRSKKAGRLEKTGKAVIIKPDGTEQQTATLNYGTGVFRYDKNRCASALLE